MKKLISIPLIFLMFTIAEAKVNRAELLQSLENNNQDKQDQPVTATLKYASRLFGDKGDISNVIVIIPSGSVVDVIGTDSTYYKVSFENDEGYIFKRDAVINITPVEIKPSATQENIRQTEDQPDTRRMGRFTYLENKYGTSMAALLAAGKIWKGMTSEMVKDSWGSPAKINRIIGDIVKEEWIYKNTWLFIENDRLVEWGPVNK